MAKKREFDFEAINKMTIEQKRQAVKKLAKTANQRLLRLERSGYTQYAYRKASRNLMNFEKPRFSENLKNANKYQIQKELLALEDFLQRSTSTVSGAKKAHQRALATLKKDRITASGQYARGLDINKVNSQDFFDFLNSVEYKNMERLVASEDLQEFYVDVAGEIPDSVLMKLFDDFIALKVGWNDLYNEIYRLQDLELRNRSGELTPDEKEEYGRYFE